MRPILALLALLAVACDADGGGDAGGPVMDAGLDAGVADAGAPDAGGPMCREDLRSPFTGPTPCGEDTADCAMACDDRACAEGCFLADANPQCIACWDANQLACWNRNGCQDEWNCVAQCIQDRCPMPTPECIGANCADEDQAYADCFEPHFTTCLERTVDCLPARP